MTERSDTEVVSPQNGGQTLAALARPVPLLPPNVMCGDVAAQFDADADSLAMVVALPEGQFGLVDRSIFLPRYLEKFNREIYQRKAIALLMDSNPLVVGEDSSIEQVALIVTSERPELMKSAFIVTDHGRFLGIVFGIDLMRAVALRAQAASVAKSTFLANMSHEIRTPLNSVIGNLELLAHTRMDDEQVALATMAEVSANVLLELIGDLLDLSKIEADRLELEWRDTDPRRLVEEILTITRPRARLKGLRLASQVGSDVPALIRSDPTRLRQILLNFVGNAIKFTETGTIMLSATVTGGDDNIRQLRFDVVDTGIGFDPSRAEALFEPFVQEDMTTTRRFGGTGLGLTISKKIAELLGGAVGCDAIPGLGADFWCAIPAEMVAPAPSHPRPTGQVGRVLVIGGGDERRATIVGLLESAGMAVDTVAAESAATLPDRRNWQSVVVIAEGDADGLADGIAAWANLAPNAIVLIAADDPRLLYRAYRAGAGHVLVVPRQLSDLAELAAMAGPGDVADAAVPGDAASPATIWVDHRPILVIDDTATNRELASRQLHRLGLRCDLAENGQVGLEMAMAGDYSLVLVDGSMPIMDGPTFVAHFRDFERDHRGARTPVIAMTAHAMAGDADRFLAAGMDDYLAKPVTLRKLEKMLRTWLSVEDAPAETPVSPGVDEDRGEIIDFAWLTSMIGEDDPAALAELLGIFVEDFPSLLRAVSEALGHADRTALARAAHACKSAASSAAAKALTAIMLQLEHTAATADLGDLQQGLAAADQEFHRVTAEIAKLSAAG